MNPKNNKLNIFLLIVGVLTFLKQEAEFSTWTCQPYCFDEIYSEYIVDTGNSFEFSDASSVDNSRQYVSDSVSCCPFLLTDFASIRIAAFYDIINLPLLQIVDFPQHKIVTVLHRKTIWHQSSEELPAPAYC